MDLTKNICTILLIFVSIGILAINYQFISVGELSISFGGISLSNIKATNELFFPIIALSLVLGFSICHILHLGHKIADSYCAGYRESPAFVELVRVEVAAASQSDKYGAPSGGLRPSLIKKKFDIGRFTTPDGRNSNLASIKPETRIHLQGIAHGICRAMLPKLWLSVYAPLVFGIWALWTIAV